MTDTDLREAVRWGTVESVRKFLADGRLGNPEADSNGALLHDAVARWNQEDASAIATLLLAAGVGVNSTNNVGYTPLHGVALTENTDLARMLIERGADATRLTPDGRSPFFLAVTHGKMEMAELLEAHAGRETVPDEAVLACEFCTGLLEPSLGDDVEFICACGESCGFPISVIDRGKGIAVMHESCGRTAQVPPTVWCPVCGVNLRREWENLIVRR